MNEQKRKADNLCNEPTSIPGLDAQLTELIECVWACEVAARREARIDATIGVRIRAITWGGGLKAAN